MSENTYERLVSKAKSVDYIVGPEMKFMVQDSVKRTHKSDLEKRCTCSGQSTLTCEDYNLSLLADFLYNLDKQASQKIIIGNGSPNALALYFKDKDGSNGVVEYIATDRSGKKYITLTEKGVMLFRDIWNSGRAEHVHPQFVPFSVLERDGFNIVVEAEDAIDRKAIYSLDETNLVKVENGPSILVQNSLKSAGFTDEYRSSDDSIVGSRNSINGSYLTGRKS